MCNSKFKRHVNDNVAGLAMEFMSVGLWLSTKLCLNCDVIKLKLIYGVLIRPK